MFNINRSLKKGVRYPDKELLGDYHGLHFADINTSCTGNVRSR